MTRPQMAGPGNSWQLQRGTDVVDAEGTHLGKVIDIRDGYLMVRRGRFMVTDSYVPFAAIGSHDAHTVHLNVVADERAMELWHQRPISENERSESMSEQDLAQDMEAQLDALTDGDGNVRVPVLRDELVTSKRPVVRGVVRIETRVFTHEQVLEVPVTEERARLETHAQVTGDEGRAILLPDGTFELPFYGEEVDVERQVRVIEEIVLTRDAVEMVRRVTGTVQTSEVEVIDTTVETPVTKP